MTDAQPKFMTTREVADLLRVKERKIYELAAEGAIPCHRVTGKLLFPRTELDAWLAGGKPSPTGNRPSVVAGSHDPLLDWAIRESGSALATLFDGSLNGLDRMERGEAVAAGLHVFDAAADDWNVPHLKRLQTANGFVLVEWAKRQQGLIVSAETARRVRSVGDLSGARVVRRQPSAGAGLLFDHLTGEAGLDPGAISFTTGFARTEADAAATVAAGDADAAPGLEAMAAQFGLAFVPTMLERFDLLVDRRSWFEPPFQTLLSFARSAAFSDKAASMAGYDISGLGTVHWNAP